MTLRSASDDSGKSIRHVDRFLRAAAHFAAAAMATYDSEPYDPEAYDSEPVSPMPQARKSGKTLAARRLSTEVPSDAERHPTTAVHSDAAEPGVPGAAAAAQEAGTPKACRSHLADLGTDVEEPCHLFQRPPVAKSQQVQCRPQHVSIAEPLVCTRHITLCP